MDKAEERNCDCLVIFLNDFDGLVIDKVYSARVREVREDEIEVLILCYLAERVSSSLLFDTHDRS